MRVRVLSRREVEAGSAEGADAVISIRPSSGEKEPGLALALTQATRGESARLLRLCFDDIGIVAYGRRIGPTMEQVQAALQFARSILDGRNLFDGAKPDPLIVVHCEQGKSRSTALAIAVLADHLGFGREADAVSAVLRSDIEGRMQPNPLVVSLADSCLFRYGRIDDALADQSAGYVAWRSRWRAIAHAPCGIATSTGRRSPAPRHLLR
jgi:predicted protein tyrosine phosphatase